MKLEQILEKFVGAGTAGTGRYEKYVEIFKNPDSRELRKIPYYGSQQTRRAMWDGKDMYVFDPRLLHDNAIKALKLNENKVVRLYIRGTDIIEIIDIPYGMKGTMYGIALEMFNNKWVQSTMNFNSPVFYDDNNEIIRPDKVYQDELWNI